MAQALAARFVNGSGEVAGARGAGKPEPIESVERTRSADRRPTPDVPVPPATPGRAPVPLVEPVQVPVPLVEFEPLFEGDQVRAAAQSDISNQDAVLAAPGRGRQPIAGVPDGFDPAKGLAAARFEAVFAAQASRAYEAGSRLVEGPSAAPSGKTIDTPT